MKKILFILFFSISIFGQTEKPSEKLTWKGVTIDESTREGVIAKFGKPNKEEIDRIFPTSPTKIFNPKMTKKEWKVLKYKEIEQAKSVKFGFDASNKLVFIQFDPKKKLEVQAFLKAFEQVKFKPIIGVSFLGANTTGYDLQGKNDGGYILAYVTRGAFSQVFGSTGGVEANKVEQSNETLLGTIYIVQFISKTLENTANTDVLK